MNLHYKLGLLLCVVSLGVVMLVDGTAGSTLSKALVGDTPTLETLVSVETSTLEPLPSIELQFPEPASTREVEYDSPKQFPATIISQPPPVPVRIKISVVILIIMWLMLVIGFVYFLVIQHKSKTE